MKLPLILFALFFFIYLFRKNRDHPAVKGVPEFFRGLKNNMTKKEGGSPNADESKTWVEQMKKPPYALSVGLWVWFWASIYIVAPPVFNFFWKMAPLFWATQVGFCFMIYRGRRMLDLLGRPERLWHPFILFWTCVGIWVFFGGKHLYAIMSTESDKPAIVQQVPTSPAKPAATHVAIPAQPKVEAKQLSPTATLQTSFVVSADETQPITIRAGYHLARIKGGEQITFTESKDSRGATRIEFRTKEYVARAEVTIWCEPDTK